MLTQADRLGGQGSAEQLAWLRNRLAPYGAGSDPLASTAPAVAHLLGELSNEVQDPKVKTALQALAGAVAKAPPPVAWIMS